MTQITAIFAACSVSFYAPFSLYWPPQKQLPVALFQIPPRTIFIGRAC